MVASNQMEIDMTKTYTVADIALHLSTPSTVIIVKTEGADTFVSLVLKDGDHSGLMFRVPTASLYNTRSMDLLA